MAFSLTREQADGDETKTSDAFGDLSSLQTDVGVRAPAVIMRHEAGGSGEIGLLRKWGTGRGGRRGVPIM